MYEPYRGGSHGVKALPARHLLYLNDLVRMVTIILSHDTLRMSGFASSFSVGVTSQVERKSSPRATNNAATKPAVKRFQGSNENS